MDWTDAEPIDHSLYHIKVWPLNARDWYWSVHFKDERVNGGIADSYEQGKSRADNAKYGHNQDAWRSTHYWDQETVAWVKFR